MGSTFEDLDAISPMMKTDHKSHKRFELQNILNFRIRHLMQDDISFLTSCACMHGREETHGGNARMGELLMDLPNRSCFRLVASIIFSILVVLHRSIESDFSLLPY